MHVLRPTCVPSLLLASGGGFALATVLTLAPLFGIPLSMWWEALVQTHGHFQLFGWAALFVAGIALYFLPRLRGAPLARSALLPWILGAQVSSLLLRLLSQPLLVVTGWLLWKILLVLSGALEALALPALFLLLVLTMIFPQYSGVVECGKAVLKKGEDHTTTTT